MQKYMFIILFLLGCGTLSGQSLEELRQQVASGNPALQALEQVYQASLEKAPQVGQLPNPEVGIGVFPLPVETRLGAQQLRIGATQMFPWFGTLKQQERLANTEAQAMYQRIALKRQALYFDLDGAYLELYRLQKKAAILEEQTQLLDTRQEFALAKISSGKANASDALQVQLRQEELRQRILILQQAQAAPLATINQLRHQPSGTAITVVDSLAFAELPFAKDSLLRYIQETHPQMRIYGLQQEIAQQHLELNDLQQKPSFGVGADYIAVSERELATIANNGRDILQLRASIKVPLYSKRHNARQREQNLQIQALESQQTASLDAFAATLERAYTRHNTARMELELYQQQEELTNSLLAMLESEYSSASTNMDELLRYEQQKIDYQLKKLAAVVQSHLALREIQQLLFQ